MSRIFNPLGSDSEESAGDTDDTYQASQTATDDSDDSLYVRGNRGRKRKSKSRMRCKKVKTIRSPLVRDLRRVLPSDDEQDDMHVETVEEDEENITQEELEEDGENEESEENEDQEAEESVEKKVSRT